MKKLYILLPIILLILLIFKTEKLFACEFTFEPSVIKVNNNNRASVTVTLELAHKNCQKQLNEINFDYRGVKLIKKSEWEKVSKRMFKIILEIELINTQGSIRIWRECEKNDISEGIVTVTE